MPAKNEDLHGNVPDKSGAALLLIDVINDMEWEGGEQLLEHALPMAERIAALKRRARELGIPAVYVNDNFGRWRSDFKALVSHCCGVDIRGARIADLLRPDDEDYFVLKPKQSGFFSTTLDLLLKYLQAHTLILTGVAGNICVLFTAHDAFMRDYHLIVPSDCVASNDPEDNRHALDQMRRTMDADIRPSPEIDLRTLVHPRP